MPESDADRFLNEGEECLRQAEMAIDLLDKKAWLRLAEDWMKLARAAKEQDI
jgi:hypothetical protein